MAKKQSRVPREVILREVPSVEVPEGADEALFDDIAAAREENAPLAALLASLGETGGDAKVVVERVTMNAGQRREEWLFEGTPSENLQSDLQEHYGPGEYRIRVYQPAVHAETGRRYMNCLANKRINIGPSRVAPVAAPVPAVPAVDVAALVREATHAANDQMLKLILPLIGNRGNAIEDLKGLAEAIGLTAPARQAQAAGTDPERMFAAMASMIKTMRELAPEKSSIPESGEVGENALLLRGIDAFMEAMRAAREAKSVVAPGMQPAPGGYDPAGLAWTRKPVTDQLAAPQPNPTPASASPSVDEDPEAEMLKIYLRALIKAAETNADVQPHAERIAQLAGDDVLDKLEGEGWYTELTTILPDAAKYPDWFARLRGAVLVLIAEEPLAPDGNPPA